MLQDCSSYVGTVEVLGWFFKLLREFCWVEIPHSLGNNAVRGTLSAQLCLKTPIFVWEKDILKNTNNNNCPVQICSIGTVIDANNVFNHFWSIYGELYLDLTAIPYFLSNR